MYVLCAVDLHVFTSFPWVVMYACIYHQCFIQNLSHGSCKHGNPKFWGGEANTKCIIESIILEGENLGWGREILGPPPLCMKPWSHTKWKQFCSEALAAGSTSSLFSLRCCRVFPDDPCPLSVPAQPSQGWLSSKEQPHPSLERPARQWSAHHTVWARVGPV